MSSGELIAAYLTDLLFVDPFSLTLLLLLASDDRAHCESVAQTIMSEVLSFLSWVGVVFAFALPLSGGLLRFRAFLGDGPR